jgi:hypothetical protein
MMPQPFPTQPTATDTPLAPDADQEQQRALLQALFTTVHHFFGGFPQLFQGITDPRHPAYITYPLPAVGTAALLMFLCRLGARRQIGQLFRQNGPSATKFQALFDVATCPHGDTLDALFTRLDLTQVQAAVTRPVETLIRQKVLYPYRLLAKYFLVAVDGTGVLTYPERHCPHCLTKTHHGQTTYYHPVVEAKLVTPNGFAFSLLTEFIENPAAHPTKQDCELKAFYRLAQRLKQRFPRLPICLLLDGLFAGGPTFARCEQYGWRYLVVLQEKDLPTVHQEFEALLKLTPENHLCGYAGAKLEIRQAFRWVNAISYVDTEQHEHTVSVIECVESVPTGTGETTTTRFKWISNFTVTPTTVTALANQGGRLRWKIENEGFNVQKNGGYALEHSYSQDAVASKVFYLVLQLAHLLFQLIEQGSLLRKAFPAGVGSAKNLAFRLLEAWRNLRLAAEQLRGLGTLPMQIRFDTS